MSESDDAAMVRILRDSKSSFSKVGLLTKLGGNVKNWLQRGFALNADAKLVRYFRSARDFKAYTQHPARNASLVAGTIPLAHASMYHASPYAGRQHCLELSARLTRSVRRHYYVYAKTQAILDSWISALSRVGVVLHAPTLQDEGVRAVSRHPEAARPRLGKQGFAEKRGKHVTAFRRRFFRLEFNARRRSMVLTYSLRFDSPTPRGKIDLRTAQVVHEVHDSQAQSPHLQFGLKTPGRTYYIRCEDEEERREWIRVIGVALQDPSSPLPELDVGVVGEEVGEEVEEVVEEVGDEVVEQQVDQEEQEQVVAEQQEMVDEVEQQEQQEQQEEHEQQEQQEQHVEQHEQQQQQSPPPPPLLTTGTQLTKYSRGWFGLKSKPKFVFVDDELVLHWCPSKTAIAKGRQLRLSTVTRILAGKQTAVLKDKSVDGSLCFSLVSPDRTLDFQAASPEERDAWVAALREVCT